MKPSSDPEGAQRIISFFQSLEAACIRGTGGMQSIATYCEDPAMARDFAEAIEAMERAQKEVAILAATCARLIKHFKAAAGN